MFSNPTRSQLNENYTIAMFKKALNPNDKLHNLLGGDGTIVLCLLRHLAPVLFHLVFATWSLCSGLEGSGDLVSRFAGVCKRQKELQVHE